MKQILQILSAILLLFNGTGALYGGWHLIRYPDGSSLMLPLSLLSQTPFTSFLIPGLVLFAINGVLSLAVLVFLLLKHKLAPGLIQIQGLILILWIVSQIAMIQTLYFLHGIMALVGILLMVTGRNLYLISLVKKQIG